MKQIGVLGEIAAFAPVDGSWLPLDSLLSELWSIGATAECIPVLLGVFERFPDEDGSGVLWSIVHGIEALEIDYGSALRESVSRKPSLMGGIMLGRLERANAG